MPNCGMKRLALAAIALATSLILLAPLPALAQAGSAPSKPDQTNESSPDAASPTPEAEQQEAAPGVPSDATAVTLDVQSRPVALLSGDAEWATGFKTIAAAIDRIKAAIKTAGLTQAGHPFAVFLSTDDNNFHFEAMVPLTEKPAGKTDLTDSVKLGSSPSGKAIKFLHRGAYDDIDSTYDLITAFLDEKGLDAKNLFIEEYLTDTKEPDDVGLEADIYVFLK